MHCEIEQKWLMDPGWLFIELYNRFSRLKSNSFKNVIQPWNHQFFNLPLKVLELYAKGNNWMFDRKWNSSSVLILPGKLFSIRYTRAELGYQILWHSIIYAKYLPIVKSEKVVFWEVHILTFYFHFSGKQFLKFPDFLFCPYFGTWTFTNEVFKVWLA